MDPYALTVDLLEEAGGSVGMIGFGMSEENTAKLLAGSPALMRIRELELLEQILAGTNATFVLGQGDLATQVRGLVGKTD